MNIGIPTGISFFAVCMADGKEPKADGKPLCRLLLMAKVPGKESYGKQVLCRRW